MSIAQNYKRIRREIPEHVYIVVAAKARTPNEIKEVVDAGAVYIGENYVQEAEKVRSVLGEYGKLVTWHMIGHLQKNKINKALPLFDVIQTVDTIELASAIDQRVQRAKRDIVPVMLEINIADEESKTGIRSRNQASETVTLETADLRENLWEEIVASLIRQIAVLPHVRVQGLMTMGPLQTNVDVLRPYFRRVREVFDFLKKAKIDGVDMRYLSMGMSDSYMIAIAEGSNMVRIGTAIFGPRKHT